jgi:hypothetical protein
MINNLSHWCKLIRFMVLVYPDTPLFPMDVRLGDDEEVAFCFYTFLDVKLYISPFEKLL